MSFALQLGNFVPCDCSAAKGPLPNLSLNHSLTVHPDPKKADEVSIGYDHTADYTG